MSPRSAQMKSVATCPGLAPVVAGFAGVPGKSSTPEEVLCSSSLQAVCRCAGVRVCRPRQCGLAARGQRQKVKYR